VDTSPDRLREVERLIHASAPLYALRETTKGVGATIASKPLLSVGAVALAGYALYSLFTKDARARSSRSTGASAHDPRPSCGPVG
jgi:hypothetical protein